MKTKKVNTLVIGSGAAGLCAAIRLHALGATDVAVCTEGLHLGTSINTGSDKQTYYKLGMYGVEPDSPILMARDLAAGGSVHGDLALVEAAVSQQAFANLAGLGVPFPHDEFGQYIGYKTDHDPKRRATSSGPYTSRDMCSCLIRELKARGIETMEKRLAFALLTSGEGKEKRCVGAALIDWSEPQDSCIELVRAENVVFATGGPGGLYKQSVYPVVHTGGIGVALEAGASARSLPESQFGTASIKFRWNVSGSYMQVLPRFISTDRDGNDEREFLREYYDSTEAMYDAIFLKGYQWPFAANHVPGSSLVDLFVYVETELRGRRVWLDYRTDPADFDRAALSEETRVYLDKSGCTGSTPLERLEQMNAPAIQLYREHGIDLASEPLEIAVCAQHNNGGLAGNMWWESETVRHLFPIGEVNGSHGIIRPGGSALNAGQVGAFRASEFIAANYQEDTVSDEEFEKAAQPVLAKIKEQMQRPASLNWRDERAKFQERMSRDGAFLRDASAIERALGEAKTQLATACSDGLAQKSTRDVAELLRNRSLLLAQVVYLEATLEMIRSGVGSRGGAVTLSPNGRLVHPKLPFRIVDEDVSFRSKAQECVWKDGRLEVAWIPCRPIPETDGWFETVWKACREKTIYRTGNQTL